MLLFGSAALAKNGSVALERNGADLLCCLFAAWPWALGSEYE